MPDERILVVDDDPGLLTLLKMRLHSMGFVVTGCGTGEDALNCAQEDPYTLPFWIFGCRMLTA